MDTRMISNATSTAWPQIRIQFYGLTGDRCTPIKKGPIHHSKQLILQISRITTILLWNLEYMQ